MKEYDDQFKKDFLKTLEENNLNISKACAVAGISRRAYYGWMKSSDWFRKEVELLVESDIDDSEALHRLHRKGQPKYVLIHKKDKDGKKVFDTKGRAVMMRAVDEDGQYIQDGWHIPPSREAIEFHLKTKGRNRGYGTGLKAENGKLTLVVDLLES